MGKVISCWSLIEQKKFEEACLKADEDYKITKSRPHLYNKIIALLILKKYEEAVNLSLDLIKTADISSDAEFIDAGTSFWLLGKYDDAIRMWKAGLNKQYTDAAGGVEIPSLLYYAAVSLGDNNLEKEAVGILNKKFGKKRLIVDIGAIASYILNKIDDEELLNSYGPFINLRERLQCKAYFYIAVRCLKNGNMDGFYENLEKCITNETYLENEYFLAIGELDKKHNQELI
jgi:hypothetical protein